MRLLAEAVLVFGFVGVAMLMSWFAVDSVPVDPASRNAVEASVVEWLPLLPVAVVVVIPVALLFRLLARVPAAWMPLGVGLTIGLLAGGR